MISDQAFADFLGECDELTGRIGQHIGHVEKNSVTPQVMDSLYRDVHSLKGATNLYQFKQLGTLSHAMETCLEPHRDGSTPISPGLMDALYESVAVMEKILSSVKANKVEADFTAVLERIIPRLLEVQSLGSTDGSVESSSGEFKISREVSVGNGLEPAMSIDEKSIAPSAEALPRQTTSSSSSEPVQTASSGEAAGTIRVNVSVLDKLMNLVGEMVLVRNQVIQFSNNSDDSSFLKLSHRLNGVTSELQDEVMKTRMQPIGSILDKFHRVVRDLAKDLSKKIELDLEGIDTLLDKSLLEAVKDPLTHLVRNSCDHGIEMPEARKTAGKSEIGHVKIRAYHESGQVVIEISDDGQGLDRQKIAMKAVERGLVSTEQVAKLSDKDIYRFIFEPGFSTASKVTTVSGRGVGMDVVKTNIERIGGAIDISSVMGRGMSLRLRIPLTLAIIPALIVRQGTERLCIPQIKLVELVRATRATKDFSDPADDNRNRIEQLQGKPMLRLRGQLLPLLALSEVLQIPTCSDAMITEDVNVVVVNADGRQFGLIVDEIQDTTDIVVKPLMKFMKALAVYSGASIMGDGSVALILDVNGISIRAGLTTENRSDVSEDNADRELESVRDNQEFLLFKTAAKGQYGMALCLVNRLEEFQVKDVEYSGEQELVRYRGSILPLIFLDRALGFDLKAGLSTAGETPLSAVVIQKHGRQYGLVVSEIVDIISTTDLPDDSVKDREGILGNLILPNGVVTVVDPLLVIGLHLKKMNPESEEARVERPAKRLEKKKCKVLLAEDSPFFRKMMVREFEKVGFAVTAVENGRAALDILEGETSPSFDVVVSDIEMPQMTGYELAVEIRRRAHLKPLPLVAVTTRFSQKDVEQGKESGFDRYFEKLNPEEVIEGIYDIVSGGRKNV